MTATQSDRRPSLMRWVLALLGLSILLMIARVAYVSYRTRQIIAHLEQGGFATDTYPLFDSGPDWAVDKLQHVFPCHAKVIDIQRGLTDKDLELVCELISLTYRGWNTSASGRITLWGSPITDNGLASIGSCSHLTRLEIGTDTISDIGVSHLRHLRGLENLLLSSDQLTDSCLVPLTEITSLRFLSLRSRLIRGPGLQHLKRLPDLEHLELSWTNIDDDSLIHLITLPKLCWLDLAGTRITDAGVKRLSEMKGLRALRLYETHVTDMSMPTLMQFKTLERLDVSETQITPAGMETLEAGLPDVEFGWIEE